MFVVVAGTFCARLRKSLAHLEGRHSSVPKACSSVTLVWIEARGDECAIYGTSTFFRKKSFAEHPNPDPRVIVLAS